VAGEPFGGTSWEPFIAFEAKQFGVGVGVAVFVELDVAVAVGVSGGVGMITCQVYEAGVASTSPQVDIARTINVWFPAGSV